MTVRRKNWDVPSDSVHEPQHEESEDHESEAGLERPEQHSEREDHDFQRQPGGGKRFVATDD